MSLEDTLYQAAVRAGWSADDQIQVLLEYIENQCDDSTFNDFLASRAAEDAEEGPA